MKTVFNSSVLALVFLFGWHSSSFGQGHSAVAHSLSAKSAHDAVNSTELSTASQPATGDNALMFNLSEEFNGKKELLDKRDMTSKHFQNEDGSLTAVLAAGPIHYNDNGQWKDINHGITATTDAVFTYANTTNLFQSYFGAFSNDGVKNRTTEGEVKEFLNLKMYWEVAEQAQSATNAATVPVSVTNDKAYYNNLFGAINAEFTIASGKRKLNYIIPTIQALNAVPSGADYLVFSEDVELPQGWTYAVDEQKGILLKDASGNNIYAYEKPVSTDANGDLEREINTIMEANLSGNTLTILTKVKTAWLLDGSREFPVKVDPTVNVYPDNTTNWTRSVYDDGADESGLYFGLVGGYWLQGYAKFNSSSIPTTGVTVSDVTGYINIIARAGNSWLRKWQFGNSADPTTTSGTTLYNSSTLGYSAIVNTTSTGWRNSAFFNPAGNTFIENELTLGRINVSIVPSGTYSNNQYYQLADYTSANRPYLKITYTVAAVPPSCATAIGPLNGAVSVATQGALGWNAVAGATSYDVYFGTASTPPLVSTSQTGTTYAVSGCLLPNTIYYWKIVPKNVNGSATGCSTWSFTTDNKLRVYQNDWETSTLGSFPTSGNAVDGWIANDNSGAYFSPYWYYNLWTVGNGPNAISGNSIGVSGLRGSALAGDYFDYWTDLGTLYRWVHRGIDLTGLRDVEVSFKWKGEGEAGEDFGTVASSVNGGTNWLTDDQGGLSSDGKYWNSPTIVRSQTITLPASRNNQSNFRLAFKWNDLSGNGYGGNNSFVVDDIVIKACPYEGVISSTATTPGIFEWNPTGSTQTTLTINGSHSCAQYAWEQSTDAGNNWAAAVGGSGASTVAYTTPSNISVSTWYRCKVYYSTGCTGAYQDEPFKIGPPVVFVCAAVGNPTIALGNPANGLSHHLDLAWDAVTGATEYDVEVSTSGTFTGTPTTTVATNSYDFAAGDNPNKQYYFQVRASDGTTDCAWTSFGSLYTAADVPALPTVNGATGSTVNVTLVNETPVNNPSITAYSIKENSSGLFVQANGSLGATEVFQTKAVWGTKTVTGLSSNTQYCFVAKAKNNDGDERGGTTGATVQTTQPFDASTALNTTSGSGPANVFWSPSSCTTGGMVWNGSNGCTGGAVGFSGSWNNYYGCFLRTPSQNCTGLTSVTMTFDISNSYFTSQPNDKVYFNMWAPTSGNPGGTYINATAVNGMPTRDLMFSSLRNCESVTVEFDLSTVTDKSAIMFYINASCGYNNSNIYSVWLDNINIQETAPSACATTTSCTPGTWTGLTSTDWSNSGNWSCGTLPTSTSDVVIPTSPSGSNFPTIDVTSVTVRDLTLQPSATLTIPSTRSFTTTGAVTNNGTVTVNDGGNFIQTMGSTHAGTGTFVVRRQSVGGFNGWSTPVVGGALPGSNGYSYNSALGTTTNADDNVTAPDPGWVAHSGAMVAGKGYFAMNAGLATFTGKANNGDVSIGVTQETAANINLPGTKYNLVGNPYPSSLIADNFINNNNTVIDGSLYFWDDDNTGPGNYTLDDYATYTLAGAVPTIGGSNGTGPTPNGSIASGQGFFVSCSHSGNVIFKNSQRGGNNSQFFRMAAPDHQRMWLSINNTNLNLFNQTW